MARAEIGINDNKGFHITFENGWTVSVQIGAGNYGDNYHLPLSSRGEAVPPSGRAEVAAWDENGVWFKWTKGEGDKACTDTVLGYQTPEEVLDTMNKIAALPRAASS